MNVPTLELNGSRNMDRKLRTIDDVIRMRGDTSVAKITNLFHRFVEVSMVLLVGLLEERCIHMVMVG